MLDSSLNGVGSYNSHNSHIAFDGPCETILTLNVGYVDDRANNGLSFRLSGSKNNEGPRSGDGSKNGTLSMDMGHEVYL